MSTSLYVTSEAHLLECMAMAEEAKFVGAIELWGCYRFTRQAFFGESVYIGPNPSEPFDTLMWTMSEWFGDLVTAVTGHYGDHAFDKFALAAVAFSTRSECSFEFSFAHDHEAEAAASVWGDRVVKTFALRMIA